MAHANKVRAFRDASRISQEGHAAERARQRPPAPKRPAKSYGTFRLLDRPAINMSLEIPAEQLPDDLQRLRFLFAEVWRRLPQWTRMCLESCWMTDAATGKQPGVSVVAGEPKPDGRVSFAAFNRDDGRLRVDWKHLSRLSDEAVLAVLGHELAHVLQNATGSITAKGEDAADQLAASWGFNVPKAKAESGRRDDR